MPGLTLWRRDNGEIRSANAQGDRMRPRANDRHFAQHYIHQLGGARRYSCAAECGRRASPRVFKTTCAAGLAEDLPFGGILADLMAGRQHISNQYEHVGSSWGGVMFGLENKDLML